ncbi:MAG: hypothetical protein PHX16_02610 [Syntrophaceticus sp.]|nr:hypothetical protein [Syntrophaceticus sp.]MDD3315060.1 hypothetical protein [Syntrophaceticus sp.]MDD4782525.1 hypothetical protein [Syntrophaceticus sp.]
MARVQCGCSKCAHNNNSECQAEELEFKSKKEDKGSGITCSNFRTR